MGKEEGPDRKRVRFDALQAETAPPELKNGVLHTKNVVQLRFVNSIADVHERGAAGPHAPELTKPPLFLHQIVPKEQVFGWKSMTVAVYVHIPSLTFWIDTVKERLDDKSTDDVVEETDVQALLTPFIKDGLCSTRTQFATAISSYEGAPVSNCVLQYEKKSNQYAVYKEKLFSVNEDSTVQKKERLYKFHARMAFLMFIHIDGASFIDDEDPRWEIFIVMKLVDGVARDFIGYATTYPFSVLTKKTTDGIKFADRMRISQVFICPFAQGCGHGGSLLNAIYQDATTRQAMEVTVEDPSHGFRLLRDMTDLRRSYNSEILNEHTILAFERESEILSSLREKLLLTAGQARRCLEVHQLRHTRRDDEEAYREYRLWVKRRLFKENFEILEKYSKDERKVKLAEIYDEYEQEYAQAVARLDNKR